MQEQNTNTWRILSMAKGKGKEVAQNKFIGIEKKITCYIVIIVVTCNVFLGVLSAILNYSSSVSAITKTINETAVVAADLASTSLHEYVAIAYETGSIARLADPEKPVQDKKAIIQQRMDQQGFIEGIVIDSKGMDIFSGTDLSNTEYFTECMKGNTYVGTPTYNEVTKKVTMVVAAPLWKDGIPNTTPVGAIVYVPDGEFLNNIMREIKVGKSGTAFMVNSGGTTIADIDSTIVGVENGIELGKTDSKLRAFGKIVEKMANGETGTGTYTYNGKTKLMAFAPVPESQGWSIAVVCVRSEFLTMFYISLLITVVLVVIFTLIGIYIGKRLGKTLSSPIITCVDRLKLLAQGDLKSDTPIIKTNDETEILLDSLRSTIGNLNHIISDISSQLAELSAGNFAITIDSQYEGDFTEISESFKMIVVALSSAMRDIDHNAQQVANGSDELSKASQSLAEGATDQASAIEELTASITDISSKIQNNANNAELAKKMVGDVNIEMSQSNKHMDEMIIAMDRIKSASNEIANIIKSIEDIAAQTNLLSLNAAIEAARAGEAGRGFSVVAEEVRKLADESAEAAKNTNNLIQNAIQAVEDGTELAKVTAQSLESVVASASKVNDAISEIADASGEQADVTAQITEGISQIASVIETNSATAEESAASSEELSSESTILKEMLSKFKY